MRLLGLGGAIWGVLGVVALLAYSLFRLWPCAVGTFEVPLTWYHWAALVVYVVFMAYSEGYRGFQQAFSPRVVARAKYLSQNPRPLHVALAPLFCMGYFYATRRRLIVVYVLTIFIVLLIVLIRLLDQPWRGIIDAGVLVGL